MLLETDFDSGIEKRLEMSIDGEQQEKLPIDRSSFPYMCKKNVLDDAQGGLVPWHWHNVFEINYVLEGDLLWRSQDVSQTVRQGELLFVNHGVQHTCKAPDGGRCVYYTMLFDMHFLSGMYNSIFEEKYFLPVMRSDALFCWLVRPDSLLRLQMVESILRVIESDSNRPYGYEFDLRRHLCDFWRGLLQDTEEIRAASAPRSAADTERLGLMTRFIQEHCRERISLEDVADAAGVSTRECTRCFRRCIHSSPIVYLTQTRVRLAATLLSGTSKTIIEISEECGFSSPSYFGKVFREMMECTPREYRNRAAAGGAAS